MNVKSFVVTLVLFTLKTSIASSSSHSAVAGPYDIVIDTLGSCASDAIKTDESLLLYGRIHHNRTVKGHVYSGNLTIKNDLRFGDTTGKLVLAKWDSVSGWRENFIVMPMGDACDVIMTVIRPLMLHLQKYIPNFSATCPLKKGFYLINTVPAQVGALQQFPMMPYFTFRGHTILTYKKGGSKRLPFACLRTSGKIIPKTHGND